VGNEVSRARLNGPQTTSGKAHLFSIGLSNMTDPLKPHLCSPFSVSRDSSPEPTI
jgi:hypothetical protein